QRGAYELLASWEGQLVRMECKAGSLTIQTATLAQAEAWWDELRPEAVVVPQPDLVWTEFVGLHDAPSASAEQRASNITRFGNKGSNLATLYQRIPQPLQLTGFLVPFAYYNDFMQQHGFDIALENFLDDEQIQGNAAL